MHAQRKAAVRIDPVCIRQSRVPEERLQTVLRRPQEVQRLLADRWVQRPEVGRDSAEQAGIEVIERSGRAGCIERTCVAEGIYCARRPNVAVRSDDSPRADDAADAQRMALCDA